MLTREEYQPERLNSFRGQLKEYEFLTTAALAE